MDPPCACVCVCVCVCVCERECVSGAASPRRRQSTLLTMAQLTIDDLRQLATESRLACRLGLGLLRTKLRLGAPLLVHPVVLEETHVPAGGRGQLRAPALGSAPATGLGSAPGTGPALGSGSAGSIAHRRVASRAMHALSSCSRHITSPSPSAAPGPMPPPQPMAPPPMPPPPPGEAATAASAWAVATAANRAAVAAPPGEVFPSPELSPEVSPAEASRASAS